MAFKNVGVEHQISLGVFAIYRQQNALFLAVTADAFCLAQCSEKKTFFQVDFNIPSTDSKK